MTEHSVVICYCHKTPVNQNVCMFGVFCNFYNTVYFLTVARSVPDMVKK